MSKQNGALGYDYFHLLPHPLKYNVETMCYIPLMTRLGIINLWGWSITAGIIMNMSISYEGVASAHIVLGLCLYRYYHVHGLMKMCKSSICLRHSMDLFIFFPYDVAYGG